MRPSKMRALLPNERLRLRMVHIVPLDPALWVDNAPGREQVSHVPTWAPMALVSMQLGTRITHSPVEQVDSALQVPPSSSEEELGAHVLFGMPTKLASRLLGVAVRVEDHLGSPLGFYLQMLNV
jgi:hypothetical protein